MSHQHLMATLPFMLYSNRGQRLHRRAGIFFYNGLTGFVADAAEKILISACLLGQRVRYDGDSKQLSHPLLQHWLDEDRLLPLCPEVSGGLPVPRPAAEIAAPSAADVLAHRGQVQTAAAGDVSRYFLNGAQQALALCRQHHIRLAILKDHSPSCGSTQVHDGHFDGTLIPGTGITTTLLQQHGIRVFNEHQLADAAACLATGNAE